MKRSVSLALILGLVGSLLPGSVCRADSDFRREAFQALYEGDAVERQDLRERMSVVAAENEEIPPLYWSKERNVTKNVRWLQERGLLHEDLCADTVNHVKLFEDNLEIFPKAFEMMENAKEEILFHMYLFGGTAGSQTCDILERKMKQGVRVRIIFPNPKQGLINRINRLGTTLMKVLPKKDRPEKVYVEPPYRPKFQKAIDAGLPVVYSDLGKLGGGSVLKIDHEKILVIDRKEAMVGGMNFADTVASNHDAMIHVVGPLVKSLVHNFQACWAFAGGEDPAQFTMADYVAPAELMAAVEADGAYHEVRITPTYSAPHIKNTKEFLLADMASARKTIRIEMLLLTDEDCIDELMAAHRRGVKVEVLVDPNESLYGMNCKGAPNVKFVEMARDAGIAVRHYHCDPGQELHMKLCIIDDELTYLGSTNWTLGAFRSAYESYFRIKGRSFNARFQKLFEKDWAERGVEPPVLSPGQKAFFTRLSDILEELF